MSETTFDKNKEGPVPAKRGICDGCNAPKPIVMVSGWGNFCRECSEDMYAQWQKRNQKDWESRSTVMRKPDTGEPFVLEDDGK